MKQLELELEEPKQNKWTWNELSDITPVFKARKEGEWRWSRNTKCKYINLRIDMRDLHCLIFDRDGNQITPEELAWQYKKEDK